MLTLEMEMLSQSSRLWPSSSLLVGVVVSSLLSSSSPGPLSPTSLYDQACHIDNPAPASADAGELQSLGSVVHA